MLRNRTASEDGACVLGRELPGKVTKANLHVEPDARKGKFAGKRKANFNISRPIAKMFDRIPTKSDLKEGTI